MIDVGGNFDPRKLLQSNSQYGAGNSPGASMTTIPNVAPYQPIGNGIIPTVPFGSGGSNLPREAPDSMKMPTPSGGIIPTVPFGNGTGNLPNEPNRMPNPTPYQPGGPGIQPTVPFGNGGNNLPPASGNNVPNYTGNAGKSSDEINAYLEQLRGSVDPRLNYGYNPGQWGINKRIDDMAGKMDWNNNSYGLNANSWAKMQQGYVSNLPNEQEYQAHQARLQEPYNQSVASERAAGRPGHSGEVPQVPNYTAPTNSIFNLEGTYPPPNIAPQAPMSQAPQLPGRDPRWTGTQTRKPTYF